MTTIGFIGSGQIGATVARLAISVGYDVVMSNSRGPDTLNGVVAALGPRASAATAAEAAAQADYVLVAVPLKNYAQVPVAELAGKIVMDADNYYPPRDGHIAALDRNEATTSGLLQEHLPQSHVVKAFNHIFWKHLGSQGLPSNAPRRRALVIAGDDAEASKWVTGFIDEIGFDVVDAGPLADSWRIERDTPGYGPNLTAKEMTAKLAEAVRGVSGNPVWSP
jgi:predicted dinucleotide-binding enzyme